jgi:CheY-like chemotaxis protein
VLVVDDEAPARARLRDLLGDVAGQQPNAIVGMAANGVEACDCSRPRRPTWCWPTSACR